MNSATITCWNRPEMLLRLYNNIIKCDGWENISFIINIDTKRTANEQIYKQVIDVSQDICCKHLNFKYKIREQHNNWNNSFNLVKSLLELQEQAEPNSIVYLLEDDLNLSKDFFVFIENAWIAELNASCIIGAWNANEDCKAGKANEYYVTTRSYQNIVPTWKREGLDFLKIFDTPEYYTDIHTMTKFLLKLFPDHRFGSKWVELDGAIRRYYESINAQVAFPCIGRATHIGYYGMNRRGILPIGSLESKVEELERLICNVDEMCFRSKTYKDYKTICFDNGFDYKTPLLKLD